MRSAIALAVCFLLSVGTCTLFAEPGNVALLYKNTSPIKVYLGEFKNTSGQDAVTPEMLKKEIEKSLLNRRSVRFSVVTNPAESDVQVTGEIKIFKYLEKGPLKITPSAGGIVLDAAVTMVTNYVELEVAFDVIDTKSGASVWKDVNNLYDKKILKREESIPHICDKMARHFVSECFGKGK